METAHPVPVAAQRDRREAIFARARSLAADRVVVPVGLAIVALHIADDNYLQPEPGTSPGDHLVSGLIPIGLLRP